MRFLILILSTAFATALYAPIAEAQTPASASSPAQIQTRKAAPANQNKSATLKKAPAATANKGEAQKLNPIVVTATRIPQPIGEIGTTITVVEDPQIQEQKIDRVADVLRAGARRAGDAERFARLSDRRIDSRRDAVADAGADRRRRSQRGRDRQLRPRQPDHRQSRSARGSARRGRLAVRIAGDRRRHQRALAGGRGAADREHCCQRAAIEPPAIKLEP